MSVKDELQQVFRKTFDNEQITIDDSTTADDIDGWDSLSHVTLILAVEKQFNIRFNTSEISLLENVGELLEMIQERTGRD